jgi:hypothetical protein
LIAGSMERHSSAQPGSTRTVGGDIECAADICLRPGYAALP